MREFASSVGLKRLFGLTACLAAVCGLLFLSGCGHKCRCNSCSQPKCNTCNTCSTCGVSDASNNTCSTCSTCSTSSNYDRVGVAPQSLSEQPGFIQQSNYPVQPVQTQQYNSSNSYSSSNTSLDRVGEQKELPIFSAPVAPAPVAVSQPISPVQPAAAFVQQEAPVRGGGQYHTLKQGETIYALGRTYNVKAKSILEANHFSDPNHLSVGTKVYIPNN